MNEQQIDFKYKLININHKLFVTGYITNSYYLLFCAGTKLISF